MIILAVVVVHAFNLSTWVAEAGGSLEFEYSHVYKANYRTAWAIQKNPFSTKNNKCLNKV